MAVGSCTKVMRGWPSALIPQAIVTAAHRAYHLAGIMAKKSSAADAQISFITEQMKQWPACVIAPNPIKCRAAAYITESSSQQFYKSITAKVERIKTLHFDGPDGLTHSTSLEKFLDFDPTSRTLAVTTSTDLFIDAGVSYWKFKKRSVAERWTDKDIVGEVFKWGAAAAVATVLSAPFVTTMLWYGAARVARKTVSDLFALTRPPAQLTPMHEVKNQRV